MHPIFYIITVYFTLGALGTAVANRGKTPALRRARWLKLAVYLVLVLGLAVAMLVARAWFWLIALAIAAGGAWELAQVARRTPRSRAFYFLTAGVFGASAFGFVCMARAFDSQRLLFVFLVVFAFDGFCQIFGQLLGRTRLFPLVSPNKTVEGLAGGLAAALLTAWLTRHWVGLTSGTALTAGALLAAAALAGDWLASYYKRRHGVKDYSALIPGHGGVLDRFDSWIVAGAMACLINLN